MGKSVFGDLIDYRKVRLAAAAPLGFAVTLGPVILFPPGSPADFASADVRLQAWLIHELTHVWQFSTAPAWTLKSWARAVVNGGYGPGLPAYGYTLPLGAFADYGLEQQAAIVEHAYLLREGAAATTSMPIGARWADYAGRTPFPGLGETTAQRFAHA